MTEVPKAGPEAGPDSIPENPALTGGVFRSGVDFADVAAGGRFEEIASMIDGGDDTLGAAADRDSEAAEEKNTSPRAWGFGVEEINRSYALAFGVARRWWSMSSHPGRSMIACG
jgi:hypothetical protein